MMALIGAFLTSKIGGYLAAAFIAIISGFAYGQKKKADGIKQGAAQEVPKTAEAKLETQQVIASQQVAAAKAETQAATAVTDAVTEKQNVTQTVAALPPSGAAAELLNEFARPDDPSPTSGPGSS